VICIAGAQRRVVEADEAARQQLTVTRAPQEGEHGADATKPVVQRRGRQIDVLAPKLLGETLDWVAARAAARVQVAAEKGLSRDVGSTFAGRRACYRCCSGVGLRSSHESCATVWPEVVAGRRSGVRSGVYPIVTERRSASHRCAALCSTGSVARSLASSRSA
jgi:hypothetical protein